MSKHIIFLIYIAFMDTDSVTLEGFFSNVKNVLSLPCYPQKCNGLLQHKSSTELVVNKLRVIKHTDMISKIFAEVISAASAAIGASRVLMASRTAKTL